MEFFKSVSPVGGDGYSYFPESQINPELAKAYENFTRWLNISLSDRVTNAGGANVYLSLIESNLQSIYMHFSNKYGEHDSRTEGIKKVFDEFSEASNNFKITKDWQPEQILDMWDKFSNINKSSIDGKLWLNIVYSEIYA